MQLFVAILLLSAVANVTPTAFKETVRLNNGYAMPVIGLGTFEIPPKVTEQVVKDAIDIGYRHIDTAWMYGNERQIGNAIRSKIDEGVIKREDIFVTTKIWSTFHEPHQVLKAFERSFDNLNISYIDLLLIHYPVSYGRLHKDGSDKEPFDVDDVNPLPQYANGSMVYVDVDIIKTWAAMETIVETGQDRSIGVSNFNSVQFEGLNSFAVIKPVVNQVECHPNLNQLKMIDFLKKKNVAINAYSPLGRPNAVLDKDMALRHPKVHELADKYHKTPTQIILRYTIQHGAVVIPKSVNKAHMKENIEVFDFVLSGEDMEVIRALNNNHRIHTFDHDIHHKDYPFNIEY